MGLDCLSDLNAAYGRFGDITGSFSSRQLMTITEFNSICSCIDLRNNKTLVLIKFTRFNKQISAFLKSFNNTLDTIYLPDLHFDSCQRGTSRYFDRLQIEIGIRTRKTFYRYATNRYLFDQLLVIGIQCIKPVNPVLFSTMGSRITQNHQRFELGHGIQRFGTSHFLGFIKNENWPVTADNINWPARLEIVQFIIDAPVILAGCIERLNVDDHDVYARVRRKAFNLV